MGASSRAFGVDPDYDRAIDELCEIFYDHNILVTNGAFLFDRLAADPRHKGWFKFASTSGNMAIWKDAIDDCFAVMDYGTVPLRWYQRATNTWGRDFPEADIPDRDLLDEAAHNERLMQEALGETGSGSP